MATFESFGLSCDFAAESTSSFLSPERIAYRDDLSLSHISPSICCFSFPLHTLLIRLQFIGPVERVFHGTSAVEEVQVCAMAFKCL